MSNEEKKRRSNYRRRRKMLIMLLLTLVAMFSLISLSFGVGYIQYSKEVYIEYSEKSDVDYKVFLKPNSFYEEEYLEKGHSYVATLINNIKIDFAYAIEMSIENIDYEYTYWVDTQLEIIDRKSNKPIYNPTEVLVEKTTKKQNSSEKLSINNSIDIEYDKYNFIASEFNEVYQLKDTANNLIVSMHVDVTSKSDEFNDNTNNSHIIKLVIPLTQQTIDVTLSTSVPNSKSKVLACKNIEKETLNKNGLIVFSIIDALTIIGLFFFAYVTRNTDINYTIKVNKLVSAYKSYIQKINNEFDVTGYQQLYVSTFNEMLDIRDTIQTPILMFENNDQTMTTFLIATCNKILYTFEIKVEDFDELYKQEVVKEEQEVYDDDMEVIPVSSNTKKTKRIILMRRHSKLPIKEDDNK